MYHLDGSSRDVVWWTGSGLESRNSWFLMPPATPRIIWVRYIGFLHPNLPICKWWSFLISPNGALVQREISWVKRRNEALLLVLKCYRWDQTAKCYLKGFYSLLPQGQLSFNTCIADLDSMSLYLLSIIYTADWLRTVCRGVQFHCQSIDQKDFLLRQTDKVKTIYERKMEF